MGSSHLLSVPHRVRPRRTAKAAGVQAAAAYSPDEDPGLPRESSGSNVVREGEKRGGARETGRERLYTRLQPWMTTSLAVIEQSTLPFCLSGDGAFVVVAARRRAQVPQVQRRHLALRLHARRYGFRGKQAMDARVRVQAETGGRERGQKGKSKETRE